MSTTPDDLATRIEDTRSFVRRILTGELTTATDPLMFEEETVFLALYFLDRHDRAWLDAQLADESYPQVGRDLVRTHTPRVYVAGRD